MSAKEEKNSNVIHVAFQKNGTAEIKIAETTQSGNRLSKSQTQNSKAHKKGSIKRDTANKDTEQKSANPLIGLYSRKEVSSLFAITPHRLRNWEKIDFIRPSVHMGKRLYYSFQDLISIRTAKALLDQGIALQNIRQCVQKLSESLPKTHSPLSQLRIITDGTTVVVQENSKKIDLSSGQVLLDFQIEHFKKEIKKKITPEKRQNVSTQDKSAVEYYLEGCKIDEDENQLEAAAEAYLAAIRIDPSLTNALNNLGNLRYRQNKISEAISLFEKVLAINPRHSEALYNRGLIDFERGYSPSSFEFLERAIQNDPAFSDAHFNMGLVCEDLGKHEQACIHWKTYLKLEPSSPWAHIAKNFLEDT